MNNTFNINRLGMLIKRQGLDFGKIYLISLIVLTGVIITFYAINLPSPKGQYSYDRDGSIALNFRYPVFLITGFLFISIVASGYFASLGQKSRAIMELMTPASTLEKFICSLFYSAILSISTYIIIFLITDVAFVKYLNSDLDKFKNILPNGQVLKPAKTIIEQVCIETKSAKYLLGSITIPFLITSVFLLGSVYFNRFHYVKTALSAMLFSGILSYVIYQATNLLTKNMVQIKVTVNTGAAFSWIFLTTALLTLIFWLITFVRLKEKEV